MDNAGQELLNLRSLALVGRVIALRINTKAMQIDILLDEGEAWCTSARNF